MQIMQTYEFERHTMTIWRLIFNFTFTMPKPGKRLLGDGFDTTNMAWCLSNVSTLEPFCKGKLFKIFCILILLVCGTVHSGVEQQQLCRIAGLYDLLNNNNTAFFENVISWKQNRNQFLKIQNHARHVKRSQSTNNELNPAKIENQTKKYVPFIIDELGLHVGDEGSREST